MLQAAKIIGSGLATIGLTGAGTRIKTWYDKTDKTSLVKILTY